MTLLSGQTKVVLAALATVCALSTSAKAADELTVLLDWFVNPDHAALILAQEKGYFAEEGLKVTLIAPADPNDPPKLVAAGQAELAVSYQPQLHLMADQGLPLTRIGTLIGQPLNSLVVLKDGPVQSIADLKGRKVGFSVGGFEDALLGAMLTKAGLSLKDITLVNVNWSLSPSLISGQVDAVIGAFRNFELNQMDIVNHPGRAFFPEEHGVPAYDELVLISHSDAVSDSRFPRFLKAIKKATEFTQANMDDAWEIFIKAHPDLEDELNRRAWRDSIPLLSPDPKALNQSRYIQFADFMKKEGLTRTTPELDSYAIELDMP